MLTLVQHLSDDTFTIGPPVKKKQIDLTLDYLTMYMARPSNSVLVSMYILTGDIFSQFVSRLISQCEQLTSFLIHSYQKHVSGLRVVMETADHMTIDEDYLTRDDFSLHKMIIAMTSVGKVVFHCTGSHRVTIHNNCSKLTNKTELTNRMPFYENKPKFSDCKNYEDMPKLVDCCQLTVVWPWLQRKPCDICACIDN